MSNTYRASVRYYLGNLTAGSREYVYTGLGEYRSLEAALAAHRARPHTHPADIIVAEHGVKARGRASLGEIGTEVVWHSAADGSVLPGSPWS
jgi:hypothetical protein